jgi:hypothetical protein
MGKTLAHELIGTTLVAVQSSRPMVEEDFMPYLEVLRDGNYRGIVVWAPKTGPDSRQRALAKEALARRGPQNQPPISVLTTSTVTRGIVGLASLFLGEKIRTFLPDDIEAALAHARVEAIDRAEVRKTLERLKPQVDP